MAGVEGEADGPCGMGAKEEAGGDDGESQDGEDGEDGVGSALSLLFRAIFFCGSFGRRLTCAFGNLVASLVTSL